MEQTKLEQIEELLGMHIVVLRDKLDLPIRQRDTKTIDALQAITDAHKEICFLMNAERWSAIKHNTRPVNQLWQDYCVAKKMKAS